MKAVILAGGKGTRLAPYTKILPKPLLPLDDKPILEVLLVQLRQAGIHEVILSVGHMAELIEVYFKDGRQLGVNLTYSTESEPLGTAGPLALINGLDEPFLVMNGDVLTDLCFGDLVAYHRNQEAAATIAMYCRNVKIDFGVIQLNGGQTIIGYTEKPSFEYLVSMGVYVFDPRVLAYISPGQYLDFPDLVHILIGARQKVVGYRFNGYWQDLGRPDDYAQAADDFETMRSQFMGG